MHKLIRITTVPVSLKILLKGQLRYMSRFFEVQAISSDGDELADVEDHENVPVTVVNMTRSISPLWDAVALFRLYRIFRRERPDIVHTHTPKAGTLGMLAAKLARVPVRLHTVAGLPLLEKNGPVRYVLDHVEKITCACADMVYPNSYGMRDIILQNGYTRAEKLKVLGNGSTNGIDTAVFAPDIVDDADKSALKKRLGIAPEDFVFIFIGRLVRDKGIVELVEAFRRLSENHSIKLLLVGRQEEDLDRLPTGTRDDMARNPDIIAAGYQEDVRPYLAISDVLVLPSYREGLPNVPMQACAMEVPCIVTDINGCNEIITDQVNGLLVPPKQVEPLEQAMERILQEPGLLKRLKGNARPQIVEKYDQQSVWEAVREEYDYFLSGNGGGA